MHFLVFPILRLLSDSQTHSITSISAHLNCSCSDIYSALDDIASFRINLSNQYDNYRWIDPVQWLDSQLILKTEGLSEACYDVIIMDVTDSTNNLLLNQFKILNSNVPIHRFKTSVVIAELQTCGRGRFNRRWYSGLGDSLTFSVGRWFNQNISTLNGLSLVIGLALLRTLNLFSIFNLKLKWPNDIISVTHYQKIAGILIDFRSITSCLSYAVIGIGINFLPNREVRACIEQCASDLYTLSGKNIDRNSFCGSLLVELHRILVDFENHGFNYFKDEWVNSHAFEGKNIFLTLPDQSIIEGIVSGIGKDGALRLLTDKGVQAFHVGDVSIRIKHVVN